ncbi:MAG: methyltransferase domain-containing protein [Tepidisphaeraceae bacterium]|jgi:SAM-dependent methyltransferase
MAKHTSNPLDKPKLKSYYENARPEVLAVVAKHGLVAPTVVELGCGAGFASRQIKEAVKATRYIGVESSVAAAEQARKVLDEVHVADVATVAPAELGIADGTIDLLATVDILEHLYDPWEALARWAATLKPGGHALVSMPNAQNVKLVTRLISGMWTYEEEGLLDSTHLRYFTLEGLISLITGAGLTVQTMHSIMQPRIDVAAVQETGNSITVENVTLSGLTRRQIGGLFAYQYIVIAQKAG